MKPILITLYILKFLSFIILSYGAFGSNVCISISSHRSLYLFYIYPRSSLLQAQKFNKNTGILPKF